MLIKATDRSLIIVDEFGKGTIKALLPCTMGQTGRLTPPPLSL